MRITFLTGELCGKIITKAKMSVLISEATHDPS